MFSKLVLLNGELGVMHVVTSQLGLTRPFSVFLSFGMKRDIFLHTTFVYFFKIVF